MCNRVQVLRPSSSTSGGHSGCGESEVVATDGGLGFSVVVGEESLAILLCMRAAQSAEEVQVRHLRNLYQPWHVAACTGGILYGLPSFPKTTPFGYLAGRSWLSSFPVVCGGSFVFLTASAKILSIPLRAA